MPSTGEGGDAADSRGLTVRIRVSERIARYMLKDEKGRLRSACGREGARRMPSQLARNGITFLGRRPDENSLVRTALEPVLTDAHASRESCSTVQ